MALVKVGDDAGISAVMDLFEAVKEKKKKSDLYESVLGSMESTLTILIPIVREKNQLDEVLHRGNGEIARCWETIKEGAALVRRHSKGQTACCPCFRWTEYEMSLQQLDESLKMFRDAALQTQRDTRKEEKDILDTLIEAKDINEEVQFIRQGLGRLVPPGYTSSTPSSSLQPLPRKQQQAKEEIMQVEDNYSGVKFLHAKIKQIYEEMEHVGAERERLKASSLEMKKSIDDKFDDKKADSLRPRPQELQVKDIQQAVKVIHADVKNILEKMEAIHGDINLGTKDTQELNIPADKVRGTRAGTKAESYQEMVKNTTSKQMTRKNEQLEGVLGEMRGCTRDLDPSNSTKAFGTVSNPDETAFQPQWMTAKPQKLHAKDIEEKMKGTTMIGMHKTETVQVESKDDCSNEKDIIHD